MCALVHACGGAANTDLGGLYESAVGAPGEIGDGGGGASHDSSAGEASAGDDAASGGEAAGDEVGIGDDALIGDGAAGDDAANGDDGAGGDGGRAGDDAASGDDGTVADSGGPARDAGPADTGTGGSSSFPCGRMLRCDAPTQYCLVQRGVLGGSMYNCEPKPACGSLDECSCLHMGSCQCVEKAGEVTETCQGL